MPFLQCLVALAIAFLEYGRNSAKSLAVCTVNFSHMDMMYDLHALQSFLERYFFIIVMIFCLSAYLYDVVAEKRRVKWVKTFNRNNPGRPRYIPTNLTLERFLQEQEATPQTPNQLAEPKHAMGAFKTPPLGPNFGHVIAQRNSKRVAQEQRTGRPSTPGYQTPAMERDGPPSLNYSSLARLAPTAVATLQRMGMLDEDGTPTKKGSEKQREQMAERMSVSPLAGRGDLSSFD